METTKFNFSLKSIHQSWYNSVIIVTGNTMICGLTPFRTRILSLLHSVKTYFFPPERGDPLSAAPSFLFYWFHVFFLRGKAARA